MEAAKLKMCISAAAVAAGCASVAYFYSRKKRRLLNASDAFDNLFIKTITNEEECDEAVDELRRRCSSHRALGFDCEWVTEHGSRQPVALVQLSSYDGYCGLFRLNHLGNVPESLMELLEDESIYKVGVAATDDAKYLCNDYSVFVNSTLDVRHIAELYGYDPGGLASLSKSVLGVFLDKNWRVRCSQWDAAELTNSQTRYAALDAHVAIRIFVDIINRPHRGNLLSWFHISNSGVWDRLDDLCYKYADVNYKVKPSERKNNSASKEVKINKDALVLNKKYPNATRTKPLYHNCFLQAPDGELLCTCDNKKALWYVEKELAEVVIEDPLTVRLRFEPAGRSVGDVGRYYQLIKENKCVVCGSNNSYIRKNVVPREYRKYFPEIMKDHSSHDVVLLCGDCHQKSNIRDQLVREKLAVQCDAPLPSRTNGKYAEDANCKKVRSAARALLYQTRKHVLPDARREQLETVLLQNFPDHDEVTQELLAEAANMQVVIENTEYETHGLKVVEYFLEQDGGLLRFEEIWRQHFLDCMQPKYMPELWSIKHNEERLRVKFNDGRLTTQDLKLIGLSTL